MRDVDPVQTLGKVHRICLKEPNSASEDDNLQTRFIRYDLSNIRNICSNLEYLLQLMKEEKSIFRYFEGRSIENKDCVINSNEIPWLVIADKPEFFKHFSMCVRCGVTSEEKSALLLEQGITPKMLLLAFDGHLPIGSMIDLKWGETVLQAEQFPDSKKVKAATVNFLITPRKTVLTVYLL